MGPFTMSKPKEWRGVGGKNKRWDLGIKEVAMAQPHSCFPFTRPCDSTNSLQSERNARRQTDGVWPACSRSFELY